MPAPGTSPILQFSCWLVLLPLATCMMSHDCVVQLSKTTSAQRTARCNNKKPVCGEFPRSPINFSARLSPQCADLFTTYRSVWPQRGPTKLGASCPFAAGTQATNPVVVSTNTTATFVMCTVPKVGSTNTRKLLNTIISDPDPLILDSFEQIIRSHQATYPNIGHYGVPADAPLTSPQAILWPADTTPASPASQYKPAGSVPDEVPTFTIGRNPYIRLVSGYRNKMVITPMQHDVWTRRLVNRDLGFPQETAWEDTPDGFRAFVSAIAAMPKGGRLNSHFRAAVPVCAGAASFRYDYYLRLEELEQWLPCWLHGLALQGFTDRGWVRVGKARIYLGRSDEEQLVTYRWERTGFDERPEWDAEHGYVTLGEQGVDWQWLRGDGCWWKPQGMSCEEYFAGFTAADGAVLPGGSAAAAGGGGPSVSGDSHGSATADAWEAYYDQAAADAVYKLYAVDFRAFRYPKLIVT